MQRVLIVTGDGGEAYEALYAVHRFEEEGWQAVVAAPSRRRLHLVMHDFEPGWDTYVERPGYGLEASADFASVNVDEYAAIVLLGGRAPEYLRNNADLIKIVREFDRAGKWIFSVCHGIQVLAAAGLVKGKRVTCYEHVRWEAEQAGGTFVNEQAVRDGRMVTAQTWQSHPQFYRGNLRAAWWSGARRNVMSNQLPSRRAFLAGTVAFGAAAQTATAITADQVISRIRQNVGVPWREKTVDNIVFGDGGTPVQGVATTMMATFDVVKRCVEAGRNLIITHETPVYMHQDDVQPLANDPTYLAKKEYIEKNRAVVFHFHDHWHAHHPDGIATGMTRELGWEKNMEPDNPRRFTFPGISLATFAKDIQTKLHARTVRVTGNPKMPVNHVSASWGYMSAVAAARQDFDVLVVGETREWEVVEYIQDCITAGQHKALIVIGHVLSEQAGMKYCAEWLKTFVPEVPVEFIAAPEPFWLPDHPVA